ncbi:hypothetical protein [Halomarina rubra]|uniref:LAGLIDADG homing endonuclease n=1 Tax=Halomarina rubra TaxID=2071873 RepID=A0ABD6AVU0_9EURY|nr:hypothetical protein [Halomarina rubra]
MESINSTGIWENVKQDFKTEVRWGLSHGVSRCIRIATEGMPRQRQNKLKGQALRASPCLINGFEFTRSFSKGIPVGHFSTLRTSHEHANPPELLTFFRNLEIPSQPVVFNTDEHQKSFTAIERGLHELVISSGGWSDDWFSIQNGGSLFTGTGMKDFLGLLRPFPSYNPSSSPSKTQSIHGQFIIRLCNNEYLIFNVEQDGCSNEEYRTQITFLTDGHPLDGQRYREYAAGFGLYGLSNGKDHQFDIRTITPKEDIPLQINHSLDGRRSLSGRFQVAGFTTENPLWEPEELSNNASRRPHNCLDEGFSSNRIYREIKSSTFVCVWFETPRSELAKEPYRLKTIKIQDLAPILGNRGSINVHMTVASRDS